MNPQRFSYSPVQFTITDEPIIRPPWQSFKLSLYAAWRTWTFLRQQRREARR